MSDTVASQDLRDKIAAYVKKHSGVKNAAAQLGITKEALARAAAGFSVRSGTLAQIREKLR